MLPLRDNIRRGGLPLMTIAVVVANVVAYALAAAHGGSLTGGPSEQTTVRYGAIPYEFAHWGQHCALGLAGLQQALLCTGHHGVIGSAGPQPATWETAFTAMFLHANILHLAVNMVFLGVSGASVEGRVGRLAFLAFYLLGGLVALALQVLAAPDTTTPMLGGSGAIAAVLGAYIVLYPRARIRTLVVLVFRVTFVELEAWVVLAAWFALDAVLGALGLAARFGGGTGAAYYAHWSGFAFGAIVAITLLARPRNKAPTHRIAA